jgi:hypothetical protein
MRARSDGTRRVFLRLASERNAWGNLSPQELENLWREDGQVVIEG